jgi:predicted oxidoreductase
MAWSPLGGGRLFNIHDEKSLRINQKLEQIAQELDVEGTDKIAYAWILNHPVKALPIAGSGKIERLSRAVDSLNIKLSREQWFEIFVASQGKALP